MQGIFGVSLILHFVAQGVLFALHAVDIELHTDEDVWPISPILKQCYEARM